MCVCYVARRRLDGVAVRGSHRLRVVAERALPRRRAPAVRAADRCADARPRIISQTALRRAIGPRTPAAHVKVLVSHDASEAAAGASLLAGAASRRAALNLWLLASAGDHWLVRSEPFGGKSAHSPYNGDES